MTPKKHWRLAPAGSGAQPLASSLVASCDNMKDTLLDAPIPTVDSIRRPPNSAAGAEALAHRRDQPTAAA